MRIFVALELPADFAAGLAEAIKAMQRKSLGGINWVKPENLHLTLNFIGEMPEHQLPDFAKDLAELFAAQAPKSLQAKGYELFPARSPRLLWLKLSGSENELSKLNRKVLKLAWTYGVDADAKALKLHVTLGRIKAPQHPDFERFAMSYPVSQENLVLDTIRLYQSILRAEGPTYKVIKEYNLK
ncbi:MAG: RNA 2',3'-cyclic phosphodiesterase [Candidatus Cloacimonetes bacterium]|nr:RNA 2',3'-cyclic phosphodiesterase [Candidatus Cloacimonadota bacterium]